MKLDSWVERHNERRYLNKGKFERYRDFKMITKEDIQTLELKEKEDLKETEVKK